MSLHVQWLNLIKERPDESWLTPSQRKVYERLLTKWKTHNFVNVYGKPGSGKTFIAHILAKSHGYVHTHDLGNVPEGVSQVILDDATYVRRMRPLLQFNDWRRVILLTQSRVSEDMPQVALKLTESDVRHFEANLAGCSIQFTETIPQGTDLAAIIRQELVARGEAHVHQ